MALRPGARCTADGVIAYCQGRMTHFKRPASVVFVEALPKGGTGKALKTALRSRYGGAVGVAGAPS
ncbi:MAG: hypothetical protein JSU00_29695 [Acidobacteria bacterium]|nr:hypothetical protein [Acidobacteriota bacterium]